MTDTGVVPRGGTVGILVAVGSVVTVGTLPAFLVGGLAVQIRAELGFSVVVLGLAASMFFAAAAAVSRALTVVPARWGPTVALRASALGSATVMLLLALTPNTPWLIGALVLAGVPNALSQPSANQLIMTWIPEHRRAFSFAVKQCAIPVATLSAGLSVPLIGLTVGWRWAFVAAAAVALLAAVSVPTLPWEKRPRVSAAPRTSAGAVLLGLAAVTGLGTAAANAMGTFVTVSAVDIGYDEAHAGLVLAMGSLAGLTTRLVAGHVADRVRPDLLRVTAVMLALGSLGYLLLALNHPVSFLVGLLLGFGAGWAWPGIFNYAVSARYPDRVATATATTQTGVYLGAAAGPLLFGVVADHASTPWAWATATGLTVVATTLLMIIRRAT